MKLHIWIVRDIATGETCWRGYWSDCQRILRWWNDDALPARYEIARAS